MLVIEPRGEVGGDEELRSIGVGTSVCHGQRASFLVLFFKILVIEFSPPDRVSASTVTVGEIASLQHESRNDTVEFAAFVTKSLLAGS